MSARVIPEKTRAAQLAASDPDASAWVSANAGSGKTYVLAQRVIRLLLRGVPPGRILCLTFTKAAAAHMANQVLKTLRDWVGLDDAALDAKLAALDGTRPTPERRAMARRLFATALETPGGLKVQTIHAFCDRILHQFPFEARVPAGFEVLEEAREADLLNRARSDVLLEAARNLDGPLGAALALVVAAASDKSLGEVFDETVRARRKLRGLLEPDGLERADKALAAALGLSPGDTLASVEQEIIVGPHLPRSEWMSAAAALRELGGNPQKRGEQLMAASQEAGRSQAIDAYLSVFCTDKGAIRAESQFGGAKLRESDLTLRRLIAERERLPGLMEKRRAAEAFERTSALHRLGRAMIARYEAMKEARGALDYDDLVSKTADLLADQQAAWVHYKLDGGIDHILIDEAQDTSPEQWSVIEHLAKEFFAGQGATGDRARTIFAVGDEKQSIFRFQGADPVGFDRMRGTFESRVTAAKQHFAAKRLDLSFRSAAGIVNAVDAVFARPEAFSGLTGQPEKTIHEAIRADAPALVELWDAVQPADDAEDELAWDAPLNARSQESGPALLAKRIAKGVKRWLAGGISIGDPVTEQLRCPDAGDIIVLVRRRGPLFEAILRELKQAGVAVAGADRLKLAEHIAILDIAALGDALMLRSDDLALACALKSPLFGLDEDDLFRLAHGRAGTLADALDAAAAEDKKFAAAAAKLTHWRAEARALRPFDFLSRILGRDKGRERILARLGAEAADALDELLAHALAYEATETPSLQGFLAFLRRGGSQVKRDLEVESKAVRVMTVHGVKGLEAPIVVLADTTAIPDKRHHPKLMAASAAAGAPLIWAAGEDCTPLVTARDSVTRAEEEEYRRLLYVALTRARDALIVCGCQPKRPAALPDGCWYRLVRDALEAAGEDFFESQDHGYGFTEKVWRWRYRKTPALAPAASRQKVALTKPKWLRESAAEKAANTIRPVEARASEHGVGAAATERALARRRGVLIHRLLQELPRFAASERTVRASRFLERAAADLGGEMRETMAAEAIRVLTDPRLALLFGAGSRAEVDLLGSWSGQNEITGRVDRLVVTPNAILIADYKSDARAPACPEAAPPAYIAQIARYRAVLGRLFPGRAMQCFLVWTAIPAIHEMPAQLLDAAFPASRRRETA